jgi:hypothetical protein
MATAWFFMVECDNGMAWFFMVECDNGMAWVYGFTRCFWMFTAFFSFFFFCFFVALLRHHTAYVTHDRRRARVVPREAGQHVDSG